MSSTVKCEACAEENKLGTTRCARCGAEMKVTAETTVDPELAAFNVAQADIEEKNRQEHREWMLRDIANTGGVFNPGSP